jgi:hypothetical protein
MNKWIGLLIATSVSVFAIIAVTHAEEQVVKLRDSTRLVIDQSNRRCRDYNGYPSGVEAMQERCSIPSIANEAYEHLSAKNGDDAGFADVAQLRRDFTFSVYTKGDVDKIIAGVHDDISRLQKDIDHKAAVFDDSERAILMQIDKLPAELPTNAQFYQQMRERLKTDIAAELDKVRQAGGPQ